MIEAFEVPCAPPSVKTASTVQLISLFLSWKIIWHGCCTDDMPVNVAQAVFTW